MHQAERKAWLFGPWTDLLFGAGLAYCSFFALLMLSGEQMRAAFPMWVLLIAVVFLSMPHYGATLLRVYERRDDRRAYALFSVYATLALGVAFVWGVHNVFVGTVLFTLYLTWSPWHYTGQNYGITLLFLNRRDVPVTANLKQLIYASFVLSYVVTFFFIHGPTTYMPYRGQSIHYMSLNIPAIVADLVLFSALVGYGITLVASLLMLFRAGGRRVLPAALLMFTQAVWFVGPAVAKNWFPDISYPILGRAWTTYAFVWIALGHGLQYLWITAFYATETKRAKNSLRFYGKALLVGCSIWTIPVLVFAPSVSGKLPYDIGLATTLAATVNLHHFILDGAIWKLRDSRVAKILLRKDRPAEPAAPLVAGGYGMGTKLLVAVGVLSIAISIGGVLEREFGLNRSLSTRALDRAETAARRLAWIGQDSPSTHEQLARVARANGEHERARQHLERGVLVYPTTFGWMSLGEARESGGELPAAIDAYEQSVAIDADNRTAQMLLALAYARSGDHDSANAVLTEDLKRPKDPGLRSQMLRDEVLSILTQ